MKKQKFAIGTVMLVFLVLLAVNLRVASADTLTIEQLQSQIQSLMQQIRSLQSQLAQLRGGNGEGWCHLFGTNLGVGASGEDVVALQTILQKEGFDVGRDIGDTPHYGEFTAAAVTGFQEKYKSDVLTPNGLNFGTGFTGRGTRAKLNALYGCATVLNPPPPIVSTPTTGQPSYKVDLSSVLVRGNEYGFYAQVLGASSSPVLFFLERPDGTMKYDGVNTGDGGSVAYTDSSGKWDFEGRQQITSQGENGTWTSWVTVGGVASNKLTHTVVGSTAYVPPCSTGGDARPEDCYTPPRDMSLPSASFASPHGNQVVSGMITVSVNATDNVAVTRVQLNKDDKVLGVSEIVQPGAYNFPWDTTLDSNGQHFLTVKASDAAGNSSQASIIVYVYNTHAPESTTTVSVMPTFSVVTPGDSLTHGSVFLIHWSSTSYPSTASVRIDLYQETLNNATPPDIVTTIASSAQNSGTYYWSIPTSIPQAPNYHIGVTCSEAGLMSYGSCGGGMSGVIGIVSGY